MYSYISKFAKNKFLNLYNKNFNFIILFIFFIRFLYIFFNGNSTGDLPFYSEIANGIINDCGIGTISENGDCFKIVGHFFPGFFYLLALSNISGAGVKGLVILISIFGFIASLLLAFSIKKYTNNANLAKSTFILISLSPLTLGWSRFILMEPFLTNLGICVLILFLDIFYEGFNKKNLCILLFLQIFSIYIKPTSILFSIPFFVLAFNKLKLKSFIYVSFIWILIISISITPWGVRNLKYGGNKPFESAYNSNFFSGNNSGYLRWVNTWMITEHEHAQNVFKLYKSNMNLTIEKSPMNPFIKNSKILNLKEKYINVDQFTPEDNKFFLELSKQRGKKLGILGHLLLYSSRTLSLMLNPLNSWGWPIEIPTNMTKDFLNLRENINLLIKPNIFLLASSKLFLFFYRLIFFMVFFRGLINTLITGKLSIFKTNSITKILGLSSVLFLVSVLYLIVVGYPCLEHRYISIIIPWMEVSALFYFFKFKKKFLRLKLIK